MAVLQSLIKSLGKTTKEGIERIIQNCMLRIKTFACPRIGAIGTRLTLEAFNRQITAKAQWGYRQPATEQARSTGMDTKVAESGTGPRTAGDT